VPETLAWRFSISALILGAIVFISRRPLPKRIMPVILLGFLGFAPQAGIYFLTLSFLDPGITSLLLYTYPAFVVLIGFVLWRRKPSKAQLIALGLSLAGCVVAFWRQGRYPLLGIILGLAVGFTYAAYLVASEKILAEVDSILATAVLMCASAIVYWIAALLGGSAGLGGHKAPEVLGTIGWLLGLSVVATVIPIACILAAVRKMGASDASLVSTLEPVLTIALSAIFIGERFGLAQFVGGALILAAVLALHFAGMRGAADSQPVG
jgi:drug/metabolite transporter (DMT)-like permease